MKPPVRMTDPTPPISHILIVDDEEDCNFVTRLVLQRSGFEGTVTCFTSALGALDHLEQSTVPPDLIFLDINMPGMTGFEFLGACEQATLLPNGRTSVVMFSSSNRPCDMEQADRYGSVIGYVEKALTTEAFERMAQEHARQRNGINFGTQQ